MSAASASLGALELGATLTTFFFGIATVQTYHYYRRYTSDLLWLKSMVAVLWCFELAQLLAITTGLYPIVTRQSESMSLPRPFAWSALFGGILPPAAQAFFVYRVRVFSKKTWLTLFCGTLCVLRFFLDVGAGIYTIKVPVSVAELAQRLSWAVMAVLIIGSISDAIVAGSMCYYLKRERAFALGPTTKLLDRLIAYTIETSLITSLTAIAILLCFKTMPNTIAWFGVNMFHGQVCVNALLANLNARKAHSNVDNAHISFSHSTFRANVGPSDSDESPSTSFGIPGKNQGAAPDDIPASGYGDSDGMPPVPLFTPGAAIEVCLGRDTKVQQEASIAPDKSTGTLCPPPSIVA
ncbi:hypothetical protein BV22DRAFT_675237 [Leucogyrophana mollusca]|uniref:Uncharacterized protein n=1 Tax=Leucogyrophana mollusca TaxID=85980 RepID=A0ACB8BA71_9AGAM|nr:hypothetical protein BV22DRAFT_675237 [Leucogyrophana mollusca]